MYRLVPVFLFYNRGAKAKEELMAKKDEQLFFISESKKRDEKKKRRRKAKSLSENTSFKESFAKILALEVPSEALADVIKESPLGEKISYQEAILLAQIIKATNGDTQAATFVRDTSGNKIKETDGKEIQRKKFEDF